MKGIIMTTLKDLRSMSKTEIRELNKKNAKNVAKKLITGVVATVAIHFASEYVIGKLEKKAPETESE